MPWKLIGFLVLMGLILAFVGFNADHAVDVSFGFYRFEDVPIFVSLFIAFALGVLITLPLALRRRSPRRTSTAPPKRPKREAGEKVADHEKPPDHEEPSRSGNS
ncbi:MAG: hypothetical protein ACLFM5_03890 [Spirochaetaceae bacterium]